MSRTKQNSKEPKKSLRNSKVYWRNSSVPRTQKLDRLMLTLCFQRSVLLRYLQAKVEANDMHAVSDAANDILEIDAKLETLEAVKQA